MEGGGDGIIGRRAVHLLGAQQRHLRADERSVHPEEREERVWRHRAPGLAVAVEERVAEPVVAREVEQLHAQERELIRHVDRPQVGELQPIDHLHAAVVDQDVLGAEVAVTVDDESAAARAASDSDQAKRKASRNRWSANRSRAGRSWARRGAPPRDCGR